MTNQVFPWATFLVFAVVNCVTPGPNVILLAGSGSKWGFRKSLPAIVGVSIGFPLMLLIVQFGAGHAFAILPWLFPLLTTLSLMYILILSYRMWKLGQSDKRFDDGRVEAVGFFSMVGFQWVNAKAWQMVIMTATIYASDDLEIKLLGSLSFFIILLLSASFWVEIGKRISIYLERPMFRKIYYGCLAGALILSTFPKGLNQLQEHLEVEMKKEKINNKKDSSRHLINHNYM